MIVSQLAVVALILPLSLFGQDTLRLEPASNLYGRNVMYMDDNLLIISQAEEVAHAEYIYIYDVSNPYEPEQIYEDMAIQFMPMFEDPIEDWLTDAIIYDDMIIWCTSHRFHTFRGGGYREEGPGVLHGTSINQQDAYWSIEILREYDVTIKHPGELAIYDHYLIACAGSEGVKIYDLNYENEPEHVNTLNFQIDIVTVVEDRLLVNEGSNLIVFDISTPSAPERIGELEISTEEYPYELYQTYITYNGMILLPNNPDLEGASSLLVLDITSDNAPEVIARIDLGRRLGEFEFGISYDQLIIKDRYIYVYDISEDYDISYAYSVEINPGLYYHFRTHDNKLVFGERYQGRSIGRTKIYDLSAVSVPNDNRSATPSLFSLSAYPNPFNSSTTIEYRVGSNSNSTTLSLYDLSGRLVQTLVEGRLTPGNYRTALNANNLAAGVYVVRMEADPPQPPLERGVYSRKVVVVK